MKKNHRKDKNQLNLFEESKPFNYTNMTKEINFTKFENPYIQVVWEDINENFTQDRIKSVKHYFQKKYNTTNVNVITKVKTTQEETEQTVDVSVNIMDTNYQVDLLKQYLVSKGYENYLDTILSHNKMVENKMQENETETTVFKKWYIKNIEFSNFLSYGENQKIDFEKCNGLTVIESNPPNFGGKTVLSVDLLLFLFFNETTKTTKAEEIFNRFTDKDKVTVKGEIVIDGEEYIIVRNIERKMSKKGEWNVKTELDFFKKLADGTLQNFTGEQRRETEKFIKESIGTKDDFLMTILTTATNLEELIDAKPTARGQVLTRFMGLEFLKRKEEVAKLIYSDFSKSMLSNIYNTEQLKTDNENNETKITDLKSNIESYGLELVNIDTNLTKGRDYRDDMISKKHTDIDVELSRLNPSQVKQDIEGHEYQIEQTKLKLNELKVVEPKEYYKEDEHDKTKEEYSRLNKELIQIETKIEEVEKLKSSVEGGIKCEHCGINLMNASITQQKISELDGYIMQKDNVWTTMQVLSGIEQTFVRLKKDFDEYEKNKLIKEKYDATIENYQLKIQGLQTKLTEYDKMLDKIKENEHIDSMLIKANLRIEDLERQKTQKQTQINSDDYSVKSLEEKIKTNLNNIIKIAEEQEKEKIHKMYLEAYGKNGISKIIMKTMMPLINSELQRLMEDSSYFKLEIRISDKNEVEFLMIDNGTGIEKLMSSGSGYERTIASLALRSVLSKICSLPKPNVIVFDEVFGKISNENLEMVSEFFVKIKEYFEKIFLITHNPMVNQWADSVVKIKKEDNISKVHQ
jgi:DNA repair exonuclease SbcCD ATPase subunit